MTAPRFISVENPPERIWAREELRAHGKASFGEQAEVFLIPAGQMVTAENVSIDAPARIEILNAPADMKDEQIVSWLKALPPPEKTDEEIRDERRQKERAERKAEIEDLLSDSPILGSPIKSAIEVETELQAKIDTLTQEKQELQLKLDAAKAQIDQNFATMEALTRRLNTMAETLATNLGKVQADLSTRIGVLETNLKTSSLTNK